MTPFGATSMSAGLLFLSAAATFTVDPSILAWFLYAHPASWAALGLYLLRLLFSILMILGLVIPLPLRSEDNYDQKVMWLRWTTAFAISWPVAFCCVQLSPATDVFVLMLMLVFLFVAAGGYFQVMMLDIRCFRQEACRAG